MRTSITIGVLVVFVVGAVVLAAVNNKPSETINPQASTLVTIPVSAKPSTGGTNSGTVATPLSTVKTYTLADVAKHSTQASCWSAINGDVYDVTSWISQHPGGAQAIVSLCGIDGSAAFNGQHGGQRRPATELASFYIGKLGTVSSSGSASPGISSGSSAPAPSNNTARQSDDD